MAQGLNKENISFFTQNVTQHELGSKTENLIFFFVHKTRCGNFNTERKS